jgi:two-component system response regulator
MTSKPMLVLLVEDNLDHAELVIRNLSQHHVANRIIHIQDGQTALDYLFRRNEYTDSTNSPRPHLILLDLRLPRVDGLDVLKIVKDSEDLHKIPVVILTSSEGERDIARAYARCANSYLVKPVGFEKFHQLMQDLGFYWLGWNAQPSI